MRCFVSSTLARINQAVNQFLEGWNHHPQFNCGLLVSLGVFQRTLRYFFIIIYRAIKVCNS